jgi:hypothetical protein
VLASGVDGAGVAAGAGAVTGGMACCAGAAFGSSGFLHPAIATMATAVIINVCLSNIFSPSDSSSMSKLPPSKNKKVNC